MSQTTPAFIHPPLRKSESIRVLILAPASHPSKPLRCKLEELSFKQGRKTSYEAVSYAWGAPDPNIHILCHGARLPITPTAMQRYASFDTVSGLAPSGSMLYVSTNLRLRSAAIESN
jgi:hypothetical protein